MSKHANISTEEAADRLAIREFVEAYAHRADRRDAKGQMSIFTPGAHFVVYMNAKDPTPPQELHSRDTLAPVFDDLNQYVATMHFVGQSTILTMSGGRATGSVYAGPSLHCSRNHASTHGGRVAVHWTPSRTPTVAGCFPRGCSTSTGWSSGRGRDGAARRRPC